MAEDIERLGRLPGEVRWQLALTIVVLLLLILAGVGLVLVVRAYLKSLASLREIKRLAWDILASMDQGVITTDRDGKITSVNPRGRDLLGLEFDCVRRRLCTECHVLRGTDDEMLGHPSTKRSTSETVRHDQTN